MKNTVRIILYVKGDSAVGIPSQSTELDTRIAISDYNPDITEILNSFANNFGDLWDEEGYWEFTEETAKKLLEVYSDENIGVQFLNDDCPSF